MSERCAWTEVASDDLTKQLYHQGYQLMWTFQKDAERAFEALGLSPLKALVLRVIAHEVHYPKELAEMLATPPSAISVLLGDLQERGLLRRDTDPADRRRVRLELTEAGQRMLGRLDKAWYGVYARRLRVLDEDELEQLHHLQQKLLGAS